MNNNEFAKRIAELRKEKALSQKEFGEMLGVSNKAVSKWETGESMPQMKTIIKIAELFEMNPNELLTGTRYEMHETEKTVDTDLFNMEREKTEKLIHENKKLQNMLDGARKSKRHTIIICVAVCTLCAVIAVLVALSNPQSRDKINSDISCIGSNNTYIEYGGVFFYPATDIEEAVYYADDKKEKKYAEIFEDKKSAGRVTVYCDNIDDFIVVPKKDKTHIYVSEDSRVDFNLETVTGIMILDGRKASDAEAVFGNSESDIYNYYEYDAVKKELDFDEVDEFIKLYSDKKEISNTKEITKQYLTDDADLIAAQINYDKVVKIGRLFKDDNGNYYVYSFSDSNTYLLGKGVKSLVR